MPFLLALAVLAALPGLGWAQPDIRALGDSVAGSGSALVRTRRLVHWINDRFEWSATDYQRRTPEEIIARRAGNCAELASVLHLFLDSLGLKTRWVREINVQPAPTPRRQRTAEEMVTKRGNSMSVFGLQHNDHVWLEVWEDSSAAWFPADPAYGVAGLDEWTAARLALQQRPKPRVKAVEPIAADMLVPFVVTAGSRRSTPGDDDRTAHYLVEGYRRLYGEPITALPSWSKWVAAVDSLSPHARAAFAGTENLHQYTAAIAALKVTYDALAAEAAKRHLNWKR